MGILRTFWLSWIQIYNTGYIYIYIDCGIDGEALKELITDIEGFSTLVAAPSASLNIKKLVRV